MAQLIFRYPFCIDMLSFHSW